MLRLISPKITRDSAVTPVKGGFLAGLIMQK